MPLRGFRHSEETRAKMSVSRLVLDISGEKHPLYGKHRSDETKNKIGDANRGKPSGFLGKHHSEEARRKIGAAKIGTHHSFEARLKMSLANQGKKISEKHKRAISLRHSGSKNNNWKGGITPELEKLRKSDKFKEWRKQVFERDGYRCQVDSGCSQKYLHPHHIYSFAEFPGLRFDVENGLTLCEKHHHDFHWGHLNIPLFNYD